MWTFNRPRLPVFLAFAHLLTNFCVALLVALPASACGVSSCQLFDCHSGPSQKFIWQESGIFHVAGTKLYMDSLINVQMVFLHVPWKTHQIVMSQRLRSKDCMVCMLVLSFSFASKWDGKQ